MSPAWYGFWYLIFPGFLFLSICGIFVSWLDRKLTARLQFRVGPPLAQPLWDVLKLMGKETIIPRSASRGLFIFSPLLGLSGASLAGALLLVAGLWPEQSFVGDVIVLLYLLLLPSLAIILGGLASGNPIAGVGSAREMKLLFAYELSLIIALGVILIQTGGKLSIADIISWQAQNRAIALSFSGALALIIAVFSAQAKLSAVPFDLAEAETELSAGALIEYSGVLLGIYKLTRMIMLVVMPMFVVVLFLGGLEPKLTSIIWAVVKYLILLLVFILIRNTNPRLRIDQALRFFWYGMGGIGLLAIILALLRW